jgi:UDP-3-O-[3-hydroxymyristoyl] glucosamine N-acyltransferase
VLGAGSSVVGSVVGEEAEVGESCEVTGLAVVGPGASVERGNVLNHGLRVGAGVAIPEGALRFS